MIVTRPANELRLITQPDHARIAAELLSLWRDDGMPDRPAREDLLFAAREHDNGWQEVDSAPRVDAESGRPYGFRDLPAELRMELWLRGVDRYREGRPYPALLIATHAARLHRDRRNEPGWAPFFERVDELTEELLERSEADPAELEQDYLWLRLGDFLSLVACGDSPELRSDGRHARREGDRVHLDPFPFAGSTTFTIPCRTIPDRVYASDTDLTLELASARWTSFKIQFAPA